MIHQRYPFHRPRTTQSSYVNIGKQAGADKACNSYVGNLPSLNDQKVNIDGFVNDGSGNKIKETLFSPLEQARVQIEN